MADNKRVELWDNLKFILIVFVVLGHFINIRNSVTYHSIFIFIYSFHMPLFIFLSGLFHKNTGVFKKAAAFLVIYIIYELSIFGIKRAFGVKAKLDFFNESAAPWFMLALTFYVLLGFAFHKIMEHRIFKWVLIAFFVVLSCVSGYVQEIGSFLSLAKVINFFPFYLLGMSLDRNKIEKTAENIKYKTGGAVILAIWLILCFVFMEEIYLIRPFVVAKGAYPDYAAHGWIWKLQCYAVACITGFSLIMVTPCKEIKPITLWGSRTIQVYFWHKLVLYVFQYTNIDEWFYENGPKKLLWMGIAVVTACVLSLKIFRYPTDPILWLSGKRKV